MDTAVEQDRAEGMWKQEGDEPPTHVRDFLDEVEGADIDFDGPTATVVEMAAFFDRVNKTMGGKEG